MYQCDECRHVFPDNSLAYSEGVLSCPECRYEDVLELNEDDIMEDGVSFYGIWKKKEDK